jgi:ATP-dependent Clp protease ATP-binding subunit ClpA
MLQLQEKNITLDVSNECIDFLVKEGASSEFGARNIARTVQEKIKAFFVDAVLFGDLSSGGKSEAVLIDGRIEIKIL